MAKKLGGSNPGPGVARLLAEMRARHRETHPWCTYGDSPHFVPPSMGDAGFYACENDNPALAGRPFVVPRAR